MLAHLTDIKVVYADDKRLVSLNVENTKDRFVHFSVAGTMHSVLIKGGVLISGVYLYTSL